MRKENAEGVREAITFFRKAVAIQPDFAPGYASLAEAYSQLAFSGAVAPREWTTQAKQAALQAIALDPELAQGHTELGLVLYRYDWNWKASEEEFRRALSLNPNDASTHNAYASLLRLMGRIPEADAERRRWHGLNPYVAKRADGFLGTGGRSRAAGDYPKAIAEMQIAVQMDPLLPRGHFQLGWTLGEAGQLPEAIAELERAVQLSPNNTRFRGRLGWAYSIAGQNEKARAILADLEKLSARAFVSPAAMALVHVGLHENQPALDLLERAYRERDFDLIGLVNSRTFAALRSERRFQQLVRKIGLPAA